MTISSKTALTRRRFFTASSAMALSAGTASMASENGTTLSTDFEYEITRTEEEWRNLLSDADYDILRKGKTEKRRSSPLWEETGEGTYHCKGCELKVYDAAWKRILDKGWVFFYHAEPNSVLLAIDGPVAEYEDMSAGATALTEVHCRRCGSHLGHYVFVSGAQTHCINGAALNFHAKAV